MTPLVQLEGVAVEAYRVKRRRRRNRRLPTLLGREVRQSYRVISEVSLSIAPGECVFLLDDTGERSTALLRVIANLMQPDEGTARRRGGAILVSPPARRWVMSLSLGQAIRMIGGLYGMTDVQIDAAAEGAAELAGVADSTWRATEDVDVPTLKQMAFAIGTAAPVKMLCLQNMALTGTHDFHATCVQRLRQRLDGGAAVVIVHNHADLIEAIATRVLIVRKRGVREVTPARAAELVRGWDADKRRARKESRQAMIEDDDDDQLI